MDASRPFNTLPPTSLSSHHPPTRPIIQVTFNPTDWGQTHSNPSYHLPHFWDMYAKFLRNEGAPPSTVAFWRRAATQSRRFFRRAAHPKTALMPDYTTIDGKRAPDPNLGGHVNFQWCVCMGVYVVG